MDMFDDLVNGGDLVVGGDDELGVGIDFGNSVEL